MKKKATFSKVILLLTIAILLVVITIINIYETNKWNKHFVSLSNLTCDEIMDSYLSCKDTATFKSAYRKSCKDYYAESIIGCYGKLLNDQLALEENSSIHCLNGAGPLLPGQKYCEGN